MAIPSAMKLSSTFVTENVQKNYVACFLDTPTMFVVLGLAANVLQI